MTTILLDETDRTRRLLQHAAILLGIFTLLAASPLAKTPEQRGLSLVVIGAGLALLAGSALIRQRFTVRHAGHVITLQNNPLTGEKLFIDGVLAAKGQFGFQSRMEATLSSGEQVVAIGDATFLSYRCRIGVTDASEIAGPASAPREVSSPGTTLSRSSLAARELFMQLALIVAGVLLALSFEGLREWRNDRNLVREARRNIAQEMADNKAEIEKLPPEYGRMRRELEGAADAVQSILETRKGPGSLALKFEFAELSSVSRTTAELTGAFGLMDYDEVRRYQGVYQLQDMFASTERRAFEEYLQVISFIRLAADPERATPPELVEWNQRIHYARSTLDVLEQLAQRLSHRYAEALAGR